MFVRKKRDIEASAAEVIKPDEAITKARHLHDELIHHGIPARDVPKAIFDTRHFYHQALRHDQKHFKKQELSEMYVDAEAVKSMRVLLNKFVHYGLREDDVALLQPLQFLEADHMREFLRFEREAMAYARFISAYLIRLKTEISTSINHDVLDRKVVNYPAFYKGSVAPGPISDILKILKGIERDLVPASLFVKFDKVFDIFAAIKPSKTRTPAREEFYNKHWDEIKHFSFIPPVKISLEASDESDDTDEYVISLRQSR